MKLSDAKVKFEESYFGLVEISKNPGNISDYIALLCPGWKVVHAPLQHLVLILKEVDSGGRKYTFGIAVV